MILRRVAAALSIALLGQVGLSGWSMSCRESAPRAAAAESAHQHHEAPAGAEHDANTCLTTAMCSVVMVAERVDPEGPERPRAAVVVLRVDGGASVTRTPELPPPRG